MSDYGPLSYYLNITQPQNNSNFIYFSSNLKFNSSLVVDHDQNQSHCFIDTFLHCMYSAVSSLINTHWNNILKKGPQGKIKFYYDS